MAEFQTGRAGCACGCALPSQKTRRQTVDGVLMDACGHGCPSCRIPVKPRRSAEFESHDLDEFDMEGNADAS